MQIKAMITHEHEGRKFLFKAFPKGFIRFKITNGQYQKWLWADGQRLTILPSEHSYRILGTASSLSEKACKKIVPNPEYLNESQIWWSALLNSLLQSHSLQPETTLVLEVKK